MDAFVTRQPIFDTQHRIIAYELHHRGGDEGEVGAHRLLAAGPSAEAREEGVEQDPSQGSDVEILLNGKTAFVSLPRNALLDGMPDGLSPSSVAIQLLEPVDPDDDVVGACRDLAGNGFKLVLGDWVLHEKFDRLLRIAAAVKVDVEVPGFEEKAVVAEKLSAFKGKLLAKNVEHENAHDACVAMGFELFEGFHYFRPETLVSTDLEGPSLAVVQILNHLKDPNSSDREIQEALGTDPSLSYKLLKLVNSAAMGGRGTDSISHALRMIGRDPLYRWLSLLLVDGGDARSDVRSEIVKSSLMRGRLCELLRENADAGTEGELPSGETLFLIGLFSHLDTLLRTPMEDVLSPIQLADGVEEALLGRRGRAGVILSAVENYEEAEWDLAEERLGFAQIGTEDLSGLYLDSVTWASDRVEATGE